MSLLSIRQLCLQYPAQHLILDKFDLELAPGESLGLVGGSGAGKTQAALAVMGLLDTRATINGSVRFDGHELIGADDKTLNQFRARRMAMVFQDPLQALNPYTTVGKQLGQILREHKLADGDAARRRVADMLKQVGLADPDRQLKMFPHQLSGGMRQRVMIAAALLCEPELLIADEPTTALDVTVQAQILALLASLRQRYGLAMMLISHDLAIVAGNCERIVVLDRGRAVESGDTVSIFQGPRNPRTRAMLAATRAIDDIVVPDAPPSEPPLLNVKNVNVSYYQKPFAAVWRRHELPAVKAASFELSGGETLALVGESGSGKTSLVRALLGLLPLKSGEASFLGASLSASAEQRPKDLRREMQLVFQDPVGSLNPAMRIRNIIAEPLRVHSPRLSLDERTAAVDAMLARVELDASVADRLPHQLSGGQAQRVALARSLIVKPKLLILDEAVAALDGEVRNEILSLLENEQREHGLSLLFISHDLAVVKKISHRVLVMYLGRICEQAPSRQLFERPRHPYTQALLDSIPPPDPLAGKQPPPVTGEVPSLLNPPTGCAFHPRCPFAIEICRQERPTLDSLDQGQVACHRAAELELTKKAAAS